MIEIGVSKNEAPIKSIKKKAKMLVKEQTRTIILKPEQAFEMTVSKLKALHITGPNCNK